MSKFKVNDHVRNKLYREDSPDGYGRVTDIHPDGIRVWVSSMNMPYSGTVCGWFYPHHLEKVNE